MSGFLPEGERFLGLEDERADPESARFVVVQAPYERTSSYGQGSALGPRAILRASHEVELRDTELDIEPWRAAGGVATLAPLEFGPNADGERVADELDRRVSEQMGRGKLVATLGGEHTSVIGAIRAHARAAPDLTVLQIDAHSDLRQAYLGDPWSHACAMARVLDFHERLVQVGIRSESEEDHAAASRLKLPVFKANAIHDAEARGEDWIAPILDACSDQVYVTLDCDALDPSIVPSTGTPEPGGLGWRQINALLERMCRTRRVVGFDVCELAPVKGISHPQFTIAKLVARTMAWIGLATDARGDT